MTLRFHADDFGLSQGINETILETVDRGAVTSVSVVPNGAAFEEAVVAVRSFPHVRVAVHLNLHEGVPLSPSQDVPLLVNTRGEFCHTFPSLWLSYALSPPVRRRAFEEQVRAEYRRQLMRVHSAIGGPLSVDSHVHFHLIPFVLHQLLALAAECSIARIRLVREPFFLSLRGRGFQSYIGPNMLKHCLLNALSRRAAPLLRSRGIASPDAFIGVLFTGRMTEDAVTSALTRLPSDLHEVEILFHPGRARPNESGIWKNRPELLSYHLSPARDRERAVLLALSAHSR